MALLTVADQKKVSGQFVRPTQSSAVANSGGNGNCIGTIHVNVNGRTASDAVVPQITSNVYVSTIPPNTTNNNFISNPRIGDICLVYSVDDSHLSFTPTDFGIFVYARTATGSPLSSLVNNNPQWRRIHTA